MIATISLISFVSLGRGGRGKHTSLSGGVSPRDFAQGAYAPAQGKYTHDQLTFHTRLQFPTVQTAFKQTRESVAQHCGIAAAEVEAITLNGREEGIDGAKLCGSRLGTGLAQL